ncbi:MAG: TIGR03618 family F420-dependent PPOX class oxidoreductase [Egibacteraceae bacterium]
MDPAQSGLDDAALELLGWRLIASLATLNKDGSIHLVPVWYLFEDGRFFMETSSATRKARNVQARPQATVTVEARNHGSWVSASGVAEIIRGEQASKINARLRDRYLTAAGSQTVGPVFADLDDVTIAVTPQSWRSWNGASLMDAITQRGIAPQDPNEWFLPLD